MYVNYPTVELTFLLRGGGTSGPPLSVPVTIFVLADLCMHALIKIAISSVPVYVRMCAH